ncbi:hypothetical protein C1645_378495 [Glomus cerebriforme]|uniref:Uncharacterized protein n=1 Tax=Glomus cerebriforme TaxID=658196 RepID=A0A397SMJ2_9GLOM|nr:hypothetical protein C1645_378495 [Glomus cerebriforme]
MSSELELLKQRITELEAKNAKLEAEKAEIEARNAELLKQVTEKDAKRDAENAKLGATIEELKSENAELRDRVTKVEQNQLQHDSAEGTQETYQALTKTTLKTLCIFSPQPSSSWFQFLLYIFWPSKKLLKNFFWQILPRKKLVFSCSLSLLAISSQKSCFFLFGVAWYSAFLCLRSLIRRRS